MKADFTKRFLAYVIDIVIVIVISQLITGFIPLSDKAKGQLENVKELVNRVTEKEITTSEYNKLLVNYQYDMSRETVIQELVTIVIYILYFVVFSYYKNGQTIGKKAFNLRIKRKQKGNITINCLVVRSLIIYNIALKLINLIVLVLLSKENYLQVSNVIGFLEIGIIISIMIMAITRKDGRGLHDLISGTVVEKVEE